MTKIVDAWKTVEVRNKILFTILFLIIFRFGSFIPVPLVDTSILKSFFGFGNKNTVFGLMDIFSGGAFSNATIFAMGVGPYINASIVMQLLAVAFPWLEKLQSEGEEGRKKLNKIKNFFTIFISIVQSVGIFYLLRSHRIIHEIDGFNMSLIVMTLTAGTAFLMWLSEMINEFGIGNGVSILIFSGIVSRIPNAISNTIGYIKSSEKLSRTLIELIVIVGILIIVTVVVVLMNDAERRITVQYTKKIIGKKIYSGQNTHIPIKVCSAGVMPIIFAMSVVMLPATIVQLFGFNVKPDTFWSKILKIFSPDFWPYSVMYFFLIVFFTYFYTAIQLNPIEISNNIKKGGGFIPGIRPGAPTSEYISKVISRVTLAGALFLGFISVLPIVLNKFIGIPNFNIGGTSVLIVVGVAIETFRQIESLLVVKNYRGFLA